MGDNDRIRLVTLGGPCVGKSSIVKRFLFNTFCEKYKPTVEDLYNQVYNFGPIPLKVDILDTAGDLQFPAMRRLSIATAHAFLLVYSVDSRESFETIKLCFEEIREQRADFQDVPIIIAGNKRDVGMNKREVEFDEVCDWIHDHLPKLRGKAMECSAKENVNVREMFRTFLNLSKIPYRGDEGAGGGGGGLKRRSSAYAGSKSSAANRSASSTITSLGGPATASLKPGVPSTESQGGGGGGKGFSALLSSAKGVLSSPTTDKQFGDGGEESGSGLSRFKPRSRSLIRRSSRKAKQQVRDASGGPQDCQVT